MTTVLNPGVPSWIFMSTYAVRHPISITVHDTAARRLLLSTDVVSSVEKCLRAFMIISAQFYVNCWRENSCAGLRRQISMLSGNVRWITNRMKYNKLNIIVYSYSEGGAEQFGMYFTINENIMRPENSELLSVDITVHLGITVYKNGVHLWMHAGMVPISGMYLGFSQREGMVCGGPRVTLPKKEQKLIGFWSLFFGRALSKTWK